MEKINVAILGASGAVGREMLKILEEYDIPVAKLLPLASARSAGGYVKFHGEDVLIEEATDESFAGMDYVLGAVKNGMSKRFAPAIVKSGAVYIDNSSAFRLDENVPLVVSGAGQAGFSELQGQMEAIVAGKPTEHSTFPTQICLNVIPHIGDELENGYTDEEMKMQNEGRRIFHRPELKVTCTCVRVPVMRSHSISVTVKTERRIELDEARAAIAAYPGVRLIDDYQGRNYPTPLDTSDQDLVWVGRVRRDLVDEDAITLWCCGDQIRKGAAANAVQILRLLAEGKK